MARRGISSAAASTAHRWSFSTAYSTVYHCARTPRSRAILRVVDHVCIFLLIAGTYTPFTLTTLRGAWGWTLLIAVWTCAVIGITYKLVAAKKRLPDSALPYIAIGWLVVIAAKPLIQAVPVSGLLLLLAGGLCYTFFRHHLSTTSIIAASSTPFGICSSWLAAQFHFLAVVLYATMLSQAA